MAGEEAAVSEVLPFLTLNSPLQVKVATLEYFLGLSTNPEGCQVIATSNAGGVISNILILCFADKNPPVVENCLKILINFTVDEEISWNLLNLSNHADLPKRLLKVVLDKQHVFVDQVAGILCNLTRSARCSTRMSEVILRASGDAPGEDVDVSMNNIVFALTTEKYNEFATLHFLAPFLSNLTQVKSIRRFVLDREQCVFQRLLPFLSYEKSVERRGGIIATIRNCCFDVDQHEWLLSDHVDILPRLLLPLAGPEEFDEEDNEKLPEDLQYLPEEKTREPDPDLRTMLVETVFKLCTTKKCLNLVKGKNTYIIMRELHKWEENKKVDIAIQKLIDLLIGDEPEEENLGDVVIPDSYKEALKKQDEADDKYINEAEEETVPSLLD